MGRGAAALYIPLHASCANTQRAPEAFSLSACFPSISSFHSSEEQSRWLKDSAKSALLCRRKRYFNSAINKFCPFTCVRNTLNKLRFQDLAPQQQPNKSRLTALGKGRGQRGKCILHKIKPFPGPQGKNGVAFFFEECDFHITSGFFSDTFSALKH